MVESKLFLLQHSKVEAEAQDKIEVEAKTEAEVEVEAESETNELIRFNKSLQELKDLRSQLHLAADYCHSTFLNAKHKQVVIQNTKEYLCRAVVTVVDHLGSVSANLNHQIHKTDSVSEAEIRIDNLKQFVVLYRNLTLTTNILRSDQYSQKLALRKLSWNADIRRYNPRYILQPLPILRRTNAMLRESHVAQTTNFKKECNTKEVLSPSSYKYKPLLSEDSSTFLKRNSSSNPVLPVEEGLVLELKPQNQLFRFQEKHKLKRRVLNWKPMQNNDLKSLIKWSKRSTM